MTKKEFLIIVRGMKTVYTQANFLPDADSVEIWFKYLEDMDYRALELAVHIWVLQNKFPPTISELRQTAADLTLAKEADWSEAWENVIRAVKLFGSYRETEALESLDEITRQCTERIGFKNICMSENIGVERANFRMIYEQLMNRRNYEAKLPDAMRMQIAEIRQRLSQAKALEVKE